MWIIIKLCKCILLKINLNRMKKYLNSTEHHVVFFCFPVNSGKHTFFRSLIAHTISCMENMVTNHSEVQNCVYTECGSFNRIEWKKFQSNFMRNESFWMQKKIFEVIMTWISFWSGNFMKYSALITIQETILA